MSSYKCIERENVSCLYDAKLNCMYYHNHPNGETSRRNPQYTSVKYKKLSVNTEHIDQHF